MRYKYTQCRAFGHAWKPTTVDVLRVDRKMVYVQHLECRTCETEKSVRMDSSGYLEGSAYLYPGDYALAGRTTKKRNAKMRRDYLDAR